jgi:hypothetical protein
MPEAHPNSLTKTPKVDRGLGIPGTWFYVFCASCHKQSGHRVRDTEIPYKEQFAGWLCDDCYARYGSISGTLTVPDEVFWQKVNEAQMEKYGRLLTADEIRVELEDSSSILSKLKKDGPQCHSSTI